MATLFDNPNPITPDLRLKFRLILSANDVIGQDQRVQTEITKTWRERGAKRLIETMNELMIPSEYFSYIKEYVYKGQIRRKEVSGERLIKPFFIVPVVCFVRMKISTNRTFDIPNLFIKPVIDGFIDARLLPDDSVRYLLDIDMRYHGVDPAVGMSQEEKTERAAIAQDRKDRGRKPKRQPPPDKLIVFDFFKESTLRALNPTYSQLHDVDFNFDD